MQKSIRANEHQLLYLANKARDHSLGTLAGNLWKKSLDTGKWQLRYFILYQNLLFYYDCERAERPSGVAFLESSYCEPIVNLRSSRDERLGGQQGHCFAIYYSKEGVRQYDLRADTEEECHLWVDAINNASFGKMLEQKQEAEQKQLHLLQILETERRAKWHYVKQIEDLTAEVKKLKSELNEYRTERRASPEYVAEADELRKIKKVQSFFRGWLCRRRWKQIVEDYIRSEHAESMRRRNSIVFGLVECEDEYVQQLSILVTCYLRPFRMAASSKKPIILHEDVNSIFLNVETVLFLHQFFVQGLRNKMENWPTLQLGDLFDLFLPMVGIYQEYVRNHHYSLQVLAEYKQRQEFTQMLKRLEEKPMCEGRSIESFLTYPMHQIPRYIITLHELLAHTPHDHVDRKKLEYAMSKLEQISHIMHDEVSETENIRKNLAIERMIVDGCELLLDVNQVFVRQGTLIQVICDKPRSSRSRLGNFGGSAREKKEAVRQVFLFTNHLLITARTNNGRLRLVKNYGKIALIECTLVEDTSASLLNADDDGPPLSEQTMGNVGRRSLEPFSPAARAPVPYSAPNNFATTPSKDSNSTTMVNMSGSQIGHKPPIRADSGPLTSGMASSRRITPSDNATRHSSGSALSSCPSGPTNRSWAGSTTGVPHRHSTSLCTAPTETDSGSRTGVGSTPDANVVNSLPTSSGFPNIPPVPLIHRLSSNFSMLSTSTATPINSSGNDKADYGNLDFRLIWEPKNGQPTSIWLVASTLQEKAAWCSDISQCIEQLHYGDILNSAQSDVSSVTMPQSVRSDPRLFKDDVDIKFSHTLNSCKVPQIRYATVDRLLDRLTDARFLSIDFLNTFLLTYRVFTTGLTVIWALKQVLANPEMEGAASTILLQNQPAQISINTSTLIYSPNVSQEGRSPSAFRFSDVAMPGRLPVLQEKLSLQEEDQLKDEESRPKTASQVPSTHSCLSELRLKAPIIKRRPFNLPSRPMSASESPNPASPEGTISASLLDSQRMSRSEINYGTEKDAKNSSGNLDATDLAGRPRTLSSCSSPPPLIPRSPIFSGIFNIRDDPPLQLPNLSELVGPTKRNSAKRESLPLSPLDNTTSDGVLSKGHTRLAPLASCELVTDDPEGTNTADRARDRSYSDVQNVDEAEEKAENVSNSESTRQRRRSHSAECFPVGFDRILLAESVCEGDSDKHIRIKSEDAWDSTDSQLSPNNENEPDPTSTPNPEIDTSRTNASRGIVATHKEFYDSLQSTERKLPCQVSQSDETHRLVENYLNQTIAPPCREHTNEGQKSTEPKVSSNTQHPASNRQADHNLPKNQSDASASLVVSSNPGIPVNLSPITEGLDLATKLIHEDRENKGACQTLAKSTMLAALRCPVGLVRIRQSEEKAQPKENPVVTMLNGNCTVHDTVQSSPSSPRNSHEPLSGQNRKTINSATQKTTGKCGDQSGQDTKGDKVSKNKNSDDQPLERELQKQFIGSTKFIAGAVCGTEEPVGPQMHVGSCNKTVDVRSERIDSLPFRTSLGQVYNANIDYARGSVVSWSGAVSNVDEPKRPSVFSCPDPEVMSPRNSTFQGTIGDTITPMRTRAGTVVTSSRRSKRRSSNTAAAQAFAVATAGSACPLAAAGIMGLGPNLTRTALRFTAGTAPAAAANIGYKTVACTLATTSAATSTLGGPTTATTLSSLSNISPGSFQFNGRASATGVFGSTGAAVQNSAASINGTSNNLTQAPQNNIDQQTRRSMMMATASCLRVLNVVRHWITKFPDDFDCDALLKQEMKSLLESLVTCPQLLPNDQKAAGQLLRQMLCDQLVENRINLDSILTPTQIPSEKNFDTLSALDISEQLTLLDFQIFRSIRSEELLNQSWMKPNKEEKSKHVLLVCKRFNEVSRLVVSEIVSRTELNDRVMCIDKWVQIANICRCLQNYNGVLQICAALVNSSVYRLRRTWERVSKQTKQSIDRLQMLVASDGRFKSMREALHRCDPPCIPYLGMYLTDLSFIEEGALNVTENNLVNFCKMRMIAHVIREIQQYHQTPYLITHRREVTDYLLDPTRLLDEEQTYQASLTIEPRQSINRQSSTVCN